MAIDIKVPNPTQIPKYTYRQNNRLKKITIICTSLGMYVPIGIRTNEIQGRYLLYLLYLLFF